MDNFCFQIDVGLSTAGSVGSLASDLLSCVSSSDDEAKFERFVEKIIKSSSADKREMKQKILQLCKSKHRYPLDRVRILRLLAVLASAFRPGDVSVVAVLSYEAKKESANYDAVKKFAYLCYVLAMTLNASLLVKKEAFFLFAQENWFAIDSHARARHSKAFAQVLSNPHEIINFATICESKNNYFEAIELFARLREVSSEIELQAAALFGLCRCVRATDNDGQRLEGLTRELLPLIENNGLVSAWQRKLCRLILLNQLNERFVLELISRIMLMFGTLLPSERRRAYVDLCHVALAAGVALPDWVVAIMQTDEGAAIEVHTALSFAPHGETARIAARTIAEASTLRRIDKPIIPDHSICRISFSEVETIDDLMDLLRWNIEKYPMRSSSLRACRSRFNQFAGFIEVRRDSLNSVAKHDLLDSCTRLYLDELKQRDVSRHTINNFLALFRFLFKSVGVEVNGLENLPVKKKRQSLSPEEQLRFLLAASREKSRRYQVLALLFLTTDLRLGECVRLRLSDLQWGAGRLVIRVAGRSSRREVSASDRLAAAIKEWLEERARTEEGSDFLLPGAKGHRISTTTIDFAIRKLGFKCGLVVSSRLLRNTFIEQALSEQKFLGGEDQ